MTIIYTKDDFLSAKQYANLHNTPLEVVENAMKFAYKRHLVIKIGALSKDLVFKPFRQNEFHLRPEPQAQQKFEQILQRFINKLNKGK
ncbi:MAG: hypothetical protein K5912_02120 [Alphaproteobacteria bacterium]|nr:hypothetical protein [Alphaproteobacteria bacterium]